MVCVKNENSIQRPGKHRIGRIVLAGDREAHAHEIRRVIQVILWVHEGLADMVLKCHGRDGWHFGDHPYRGNHALIRIGDIGRVMIESR